MKKFFLFAFVFILPKCILATDLSASYASLRVMDKVTGRVTKLDVHVGEELNFGKLNILVKKCLTRPPEETPENKAFLTVYENIIKEESQIIAGGYGGEKREKYAIWDIG